MTHSFWSKAVLVLVIALGMALMISCTGQGASERPFVSVPGYEVPDYEEGEFEFVTHLLGGKDPESLESKIADADTIIKGQHQSSRARAARDHLDNDGELEHVVWLEFTFNVLEYLKGTGDAHVTAVVLVRHEYDSPAEAQAAALGALELHNTQWDDRSAVLFLTGDLPPGNSSKLRLGEAGPTNDYLDDLYSIHSCCFRQWLPGASTGTGARGAPARSGGPRGSGESFYLEAPRSAGTRAASAQSGAATVTLTGLKAKIAAIEQEIAAGDGSDPYRKCIELKHRSRDFVEEVKRDRGGQFYYSRFDESLDSGQVSGTVAYRGSHALAVGDDDQAPAGAATFHLLDNDADLFTVKWPGVVSTARPLPKGVYNFFFYSIHDAWAICDVRAPEELRRYEVFVTVTAPTGTVHEAFFDPVSSGDAVGYFGTGDALKPTTFSKGDATTTIQSLKYDDSAVTLGLSPYNALTGHILDFITGDGTAILSLEASAATGDNTAGTLTWALSSQPWSSGDELMLRFRNPPPVFSQDSYTFSIPESHPTFSILERVEATDSDGEAILYVITSGRDGGRFDIDGWLGDILLIRGLDYESRSSYELTVEARDPSGGKDTATVTIEVTDVAE